MRPLKQGGPSHGRTHSPMKRVFPPVLLVLLLVLLPPAQGRTEDAGKNTAETTISAETLTHDAVSGTYHLRGGVNIRRLDASLEAEEVEYNEREAVARASGKVRYEDRWVVIEADSLSINMESGRGRAERAVLFFKEDNYHVTAEEVEKVDDRTYVVRKAVFTTCDAPLPPWCFNTGKAEIRIGDRLRADKVVFRIKGLPLLYSPVLWAPIYTERKTGLLVPGIGYSSDKGLSYRQPLFLALSDNRDATLYLDIYSRRGIGEGLEYRYVERRAGEGRWWLYHLEDRELEKDFLELRGRHIITSEGGFSALLDINYLRGKDFYRNYSTEVQWRTKRFLESTAEIRYPFRAGSIHILGRTWQDLKTPPTEVLHKAPEAGASLYPLKTGPFYFSLETAFTSFYTEDSYRVQRLDVYPRLFHTTGDSLQLSQVLGARETLYGISGSDIYPDSASRESIDYTLRLHSRIYRRYSRLLHAIEPEIYYLTVSPTEERLPLLDDTELTARTSEIGIALRNYVFGDSGRIASARLTAYYDLLAEENPFGPVRLEATLLRPLRVKVDASYNPNSGVLDQANYSISLGAGGTALSLGQRYSREDDILFYTGSVSLSLSARMTVGSTLWYDAGGGGLEDMNIGARYSSQCWGIDLTYNRRPEDFSIAFLIELKGLGTLKISDL